MREILFRGKQKASGAWLHGDLRQWSAKRKGICDYELGRTLDVYPETVGQFTGLTDKNGKKIFEGDIVTMGHGLLWTIGFDLNAFVAMDGRTVQFALFEQYEWDHKTKEPIAPDYFEVIGNIHDNPELLEVGA